MTGLTNGLPLHTDVSPLRVDDTGTVRVGKSRISLDLVVEQYENGMTPEDLVRAYDTLALADVHAVIAYYLRHRDPETGLPHIYDHGVTEAEAEWILTHPGEDEACSGDSRQAVGQTVDGRYLRVVYVPDEEGDGVFVVTAIRLPASSSMPSGGGNGDVDDERTTVPQRLG